MVGLLKPHVFMCYDEGMNKTTNVLLRIFLVIGFFGSAVIAIFYRNAYFYSVSEDCIVYQSYISCSRPDIYAPPLAFWSLILGLFATPFFMVLIKDIRSVRFVKGKKWYLGKLITK